MWERLRDQRLAEKIVTAEEAASWIEDGMTLGLSGFTRAGDAKMVPIALAKRVKQEGKPFGVNVYTGASLGNDVDGIMAEAGIVRKRAPFQVDARMRKNINSGDILFADHHLSQTAEMIRSGVIGPIDYAIVEAVAITKDGMIIPTTSVGNSNIFVQYAKHVIVELNVKYPLAFEGIHDVYTPAEQGQRDPIPLTSIEQRIGTRGIPVDIDKIKGIVISEMSDSPSTIVEPDEETGKIAGHLIQFLREEVKQGRLPRNLAPLQCGIGSVANAVFNGFLQSEFEDLAVYSEVLQDAVFKLMDAGKISFASGCSITLTEETMRHLRENFADYRDKVVLRPQEITNHPEIIRRLGLIAINTALEVDIYGNVNSTNVSGSKMMNGIGGSGDFARNARLAIFVTKSIAKGGKISSVVPFVSHVDHTEHDVDVIVTEQGLADLRGLAPRERAVKIIENCVHPMYREKLRAYYEEALTRGGHTPHVLEKAFSWHVRLAEQGSMLEKEEAVLAR
jgi:succinyl-CoA:acetate CoA-transferase